MTRKRPKKLVVNLIMTILPNLARLPNCALFQEILRDWQKVFLVCQAKLVDSICYFLVLNDKGINFVYIYDSKTP